MEMLLQLNVQYLVWIDCIYLFMFNREIPPPVINRKLWQEVMVSVPDVFLSTPQKEFIYKNWLFYLVSMGRITDKPFFLCVYVWLEYFAIMLYIKHLNKKRVYSSPLPQCVYQSSITGTDFIVLNIARLCPASPSSPWPAHSPPLPELSQVLVIQRRKLCIWKTDWI